MNYATGSVVKDPLGRILGILEKLPVVLHIKDGLDVVLLRHQSRDDEELGSSLISHSQVDYIPLS